MRAKICFGLGVIIVSILLSYGGNLFCPGQAALSEKVFGGMMILVCGSLCLPVFMNAVKLKQIGARSIFTGFILCFAAGVYDIVTDDFMGHSLGMVPLCGLVMMMVQSLVPAKRAESLLPPGEFASGVDVLVVDDDPDTLHTVKTVLLRENIICKTLSSGRAAIKMIESGPVPRLILLGIMMPGVSGYEVCRTLRKIFPPSELSIIIFTSEKTRDNLMESYQAGANDYISKPFFKDELIARVRCQLELQQAYEIVKTNFRLEKEVQLQRQKHKTARLMAEREGLAKLRYQINPHFLFNALASIRGAVVSDRDAAHQMISHLAEFCRLSLSQGAQELLTIDQEISLIQHYLFMEKMRFGDYMNICIEIEPKVKNIIIPAFILQPLVENAIKYGTRTSPDFLEVKIIIKTHNTDGVFIRISNTGSWIPPAAQGGSTGIGINNIKERLDRFYSGRHCMNQQEADGQVSIVIVLPDIL